MKIQKRHTPNREKWAERDKIVKCGPYGGGIAYFKELCIYKLIELVEMGVVDLNETQNNSPSIEEFMEFMKKYPFIKAHGYVTSKDREDYRLSIEGLNYKSPQSKPISDKIQLDFLKLCKNADECSTENNELHAWWD